jgi:hypothetical protein
MPDAGSLTAPRPLGRVQVPKLDWNYSGKILPLKNLMILRES